MADPGSEIAPRETTGSEGREADPRVAGTQLAVGLAVALGGLAALSWEAIWQLQTSLSLGVSALGTALTLATTMGGMTAGSLAMARWLPALARRSPLVFYGLMEATIGLAGLVFMQGVGLTERLDAATYAVSPALAPLVHVASIVVLIGPATIALGATVPLFELIARRTGTSIARLYGINTAGGAAGVLLLSFVVIPKLGVSGTALAVALVNFAVLAVMVWLDRRVATAPDETTEESAANPSGGFPASVPLVLFGTGFVTFALEVAWFRSLRAVFWSTSESFAIILASVLIPLALASRAVPRLRERGVPPSELLAASAVAILVATPFVERMDRLVFLQGDYAWVLVSWFATSLLVIGPAIFLLGCALPWYLEEAGDPARSGRLYGVNTLGAVAGSLVAAWLLLPAIGFARSAWVLGVATLGLALLAGRTLRAPRSIAATAVALVLAVAFSSSIGRDRVQRSSGVGDDWQIVAYADAPDSTVTVVEAPSGERHLLIDGFGAASEHARMASYQRWMGYLPMLLHPEPEQALVICFGTGQTANAVRRSAPTHLDVVDVNETVLAMAPMFPTNENVLEDPRVDPIVMDGRAWLRRTDKRYDVITLEPMPPFFAGVNALYSREFYELAAERLSEDGVVAQWLPLHLLPPGYAEAVVAAFVRVFPDSILWIEPIDLGDGRGLQPIGTAILAGRAQGDGPPLGRRWPGARRIEGLPLPMRAVTRAVTLGPEGVAEYARDAVVITDDNQFLAYGRARGSILGANGLEVKQANEKRIRAVLARLREGASR